MTWSKAKYCIDWLPSKCPYTGTKLSAQKRTRPDPGQSCWQRRKGTERCCSGTRSLTQPRLRARSRSPVKYKQLNKLIIRNLQVHIKYVLTAKITGNTIALLIMWKLAIKIYSTTVRNKPQHGLFCNVLCLCISNISLSQASSSSTASEQNSSEQSHVCCLCRVDTVVLVSLLMMRPPMDQSKPYRPYLPSWGRIKRQHK